MSLAKSTAWPPCATEAELAASHFASKRMTSRLRRRSLDLRRSPERLAPTDHFSFLWRKTAARHWLHCQDRTIRERIDRQAASRNTRATSTHQHNLGKNLAQSISMNVE